MPTAAKKKLNILYLRVMTTFTINFTFLDSEYSANVLKIPFVNNLPVQWHTFEISPTIPNAPNPYMFIHDPQRQIFSYELFNHSSELGNVILNAIKKHCVESGISITQ